MFYTVRVGTPPSLTDMPHIQLDSRTYMTSTVAKWQQQVWASNQWSSVQTSQNHSSMTTKVTVTALTVS